MATVVDGRDQSRGLSTRTDWQVIDDSVVTFQSRGHRPPVFVLPGLATHVISLRDVALAIGNDQPVYGLQPTDHDLDRLSHHSLEDLASELIKKIRRAAPGRPCHLVGYSAGGTIAYEIARKCGSPVTGSVCSACSTRTALVIPGCTLSTNDCRDISI